MTLLSLEHLSSADARKLLLAAVWALLPHTEDDAPPPPVVEERLHALRQEISERAGIHDPPTTAEIAAILKLVADEMYDLSLRGIDQDRVRRSVGQRGLLRPDLYRLRFGEEFDQLTGPLSGVTKPVVVEVLTSPDQVQHLLTTPKPGNQPAISWYAKVFAEGGQDRYTLLTETTRRGDEQAVGHVWRVYHSDVVLREAVSPLEVLERFVDVYGLLFRVPNERDAKKLRLYGAFTIPGAPFRGPLNVRRFFRVSAPPDQAFVGTSNYHVSDLGVLQYAVAYFIDASRYQRDLVRHGVASVLAGPHI
jgi:hypothetical protein